MKRWGKKLTPEKLKSITDKYHRPANCTSMTGIKCNPEIWSQLSSTKKRADIQLFNIQQVVLKAASATLQTTNALAISKSSADHTQLLAQLVVNGYLAMILQNRSKMPKRQTALLHH